MDPTLMPTPTTCPFCQAHGEPAWMQRHRANVHKLSPEPPEPYTPLVAFTEWVTAHDLTFRFSDDARVYDVGRRSEQVIADMVLRGDVPALPAADIWYAQVARKVRDDPKKWPPPWQQGGGYRLR